MNVFDLDRRDFLGVATGLLPLANSSADKSQIPIIDTHIHLFDPTRPQGVPWPPKDNKVLYKPALPARYKQIVQLLGVVGAIEIEASPWLEDNQWVLDQAANNPIIVGTIGDLEPGKPEFRKQFDRFHHNPLFRGIRYGNLWNRDLGARLAEPPFIQDLNVLADAGFVMDTANPDAALVHSVVRLSDKLPHLRIVIDHLPHLTLPGDSVARNAYEADLRELGKRPQIYVKISQVLNHVNGQIPKDLSYYRSTIDHLWDIFGENRVIYGSDWPNSDPWGTYAEVLNVVRQYFAAKGQAASEKYFWKNSVSAYRWIRRDQSQPHV